MRSMAEKPGDDWFDKLIAGYGRSWNGCCTGKP